MQSAIRFKNEKDFPPSKIHDTTTEVSGTGTMVCVIYGDGSKF